MLLWQSICLTHQIKQLTYLITGMRWTGLEVWIPPGQGRSVSTCPAPLLQTNIYCDVVTSLVRRLPLTLPMCMILGKLLCHCGNKPPGWPSVIFTSWYSYPCIVSPLPQWLGLTCVTTKILQKWQWLLRLSQKRHFSFHFALLGQLLWGKSAAML